MICHPQKHDIEQMKAIWELCFGDDRQTVDSFYNICFSPEECYISKENDTVQAVAQMIKCSVINGNSKYQASYMYAACTHPDFQGRGIMSELIGKAFEYEKASGIKLVLCVPANERLFGFYKRFGFSDGIYCSDFEYDREFIELNSCECNYELNLKASEFNSKRNSLLEKNGDAFVSLSDKYIDLAYSFGFFSVVTNNSYALFTNTDGKVSVTDCSWRENGFKELCFALKNETDLSEFVFESATGNNSSLKGVVRILDDSIHLNEKIYLGIKLE